MWLKRLSGRVHHAIYAKTLPAAAAATTTTTTTTAKTTTRTTQGLK